MMEASSKDKAGIIRKKTSLKYNQIYINQLKI
jgi:hypothetical protein